MLGYILVVRLCDSKAIYKHSASSYFVSLIKELHYYFLDSSFCIHKLHITEIRIIVIPFEVIDQYAMQTSDLEECGSCESGWTMYIASSIYDDHDTDPCSYGNDTNQISKYNDRDVGDDSMASDASSGPSHRERITETPEGRYEVDYLKENISSCKNPTITDKGRGEQGKTEVKDVDFVKDVPCCRAAAQRDEGEKNQKKKHIEGEML